jgi:hypothetical protein
MSPKAIQLRLGIGALIAAILLAGIAIPKWVSSPSNVSNIVLSPLFWPYVLTALAGLTGLGLVLASRSSDTEVALEDEHTSDDRSWHRLAALGVIMILTMFALPRLGMVWTTMLVFAVTAFLLRTRHPITAIVCAVVIPLALYAFFAHVAGVAIPQGIFVRLP